mmetsp:Transcript_29247/g.86623  ORF Transcript_29247/g.86623 Transcript_29247/m.86623 type:complete len:479 (-) Transcript_29247:483-1919(-)
MKLNTGALLGSLSFSCAVLVPAQGGVSSRVTCISTAEEIAERIFDVETALAYSDGIIPELREYVLCPNSFIELSGEGRESIRIENSNARVLCGDDGRRENNCTIKGTDERYGAQILFIMPDDRDRPSNYTMSNVLISGLMIQGHGPVYFNGGLGAVSGDESLRTDEQGIIFQDCVFEKSTIRRVVGFWSDSGTMTFEDCTFRDNYAEREILRKSGMKSVMNVRNCEFSNNNLHRPGYEGNAGALIVVRSGKVYISDTIFRGSRGGGRGLVLNELASGTKETGDIIISNATFRDNEGLPVLLVNEAGVMTISDSLFKNNSVAHEIDEREVYGSLLSSYGSNRTKLATNVATSTLFQNNSLLPSPYEACNGHWFRNWDSNQEHWPYQKCECTEFGGSTNSSPPLTTTIPCPKRIILTYFPTAAPNAAPTVGPTVSETASPSIFTTSPSLVPSGAYVTEVGVMSVATFILVSGVFFGGDYR